MRKISLFMAFVLCLFCCVPTVTADADITVSETYYDNIKDALVISGVVNNEIGNIPMTLKVMKDGAVWGAAETTATEQDGVIAFEFEPLYFNILSTSGDYIIYVGSMYSDEVFSDTYYYNGADTMLLPMQNVAAALKDTESAAGVLKTNNDVLQLDMAAYDALSPNRQTAFDTLLKQKSYTLPTDTSTAENATTVKEAVKQLRSDVDEILSICTFLEIETAEELSAWLNSYGVSYALDVDDATTADIDESKIYTYFEEVKESEKFISRIALAAVPKNKAELKSLIYEMALLTGIEVKSAVVVKNIFNDFAALFPTTVGKNDAAYSKLAGKHYATYAAAADAYDKAAKDGSSSSGSSASTGGGGGGSSWGSSSSNKSSSVATVTEAKPFSDLDSVAWAQEAIAALKQRSIVSGNSTGNFAPNNYVTRSEFLKMILLSQNITIQKTLVSGFNDVNADSWYAPYVATAEAWGIVKGDESGCFNPDAHITRQDMIVMLYRAEGLSEGGSYVFDDAADIADYAKAAVSHYADRGIVSGMGGNRFEPLQLSTRAQAAQVIYNTIR